MTKPENADEGFDSSVCYPDCWIFDENRRRYKTDEKGRSTGGPIWREHWVKVEIVGETSRSWITNYYDRKVPKKGGRGYAFSEEDIDRMAFVEQRHAIGEAVKYCTDYETLRRIAEAVGYSG